LRAADLKRKLVKVSVLQSVHESVTKVLMCRTQTARINHHHQLVTTTSRGLAAGVATTGIGPTSQQPQHHLALRGRCPVARHGSSGLRLSPATTTKSQRNDDSQNGAGNDDARGSGDRDDENVPVGQQQPGRVGGGGAARSGVDESVHAAVVYNDDQRRDCPQPDFRSVIADPNAHGPRTQRRRVVHQVGPRDQAGVFGNQERAHVVSGVDAVRKA